MTRFISLLIMLLRCTLLGAERPHAVLDQKHRSFFREYCLKCHDAEKQKGKVRLDDIAFTAETVERANLWQKVLNSINSGEMPPEDEKQPDAATKTDFLDDLSRMLAKARAHLGDSGGNITMRRLNRREYKNTIRDLLGVDINVRDLPMDGGAGTFDTVGSSLFMSPDQFEQYLALGRRAVEEHFSRMVAMKPDADGKSVMNVIHVEPEEAANKAVRDKIAYFDDWRSDTENMAASILKILEKPENADVRIKARANRRAFSADGTLLSAGELVRSVRGHDNFDLLKGLPQIGDPDYYPLRFRMHPERYEDSYQYLTDYLRIPGHETGVCMTTFWGPSTVEIKADDTFALGSYTLRLRVAVLDGAPRDRCFIEVGNPGLKAGKDLLRDFKVVSTHHVTGTPERPQTIEVPVTLGAPGTTETQLSLREFAVREKQPSDAGEAGMLAFRAYKERHGAGPKPAVWVDWIELAGPVPANVPSVKIVRMEPEKLRDDVERQYLRYGHLNQQYDKWAAEGGDDARLKEFGFTDKSHAAFAKGFWDSSHRWFQQYLDRPLSRSGLYLDNTITETSECVFELPPDPAAGQYLMRVRIGRDRHIPAERASLALVAVSTLDEQDRSLLASKKVAAEMDAPEIIEVPFRVLPDGPRKFALLEKRPLTREGISLATRTRHLTDAKQRDPALWIDWIEYEGPVEVCTQVQPLLAAGEGEARAVIESFAKRAFRGKQPAAGFLDKLTALHDARVHAGDSFKKAIVEPLSVILASPGFIYLHETGSDSGANLTQEARRPSGLLSRAELANRLSYFVWSAPPDAQLLAADLDEAARLTCELDRMIASPKSDEFVRGFVHQWLGMDRLDFFQFDPKQFRDFDESVKAAVRQEVYETFAHLLRHGGSLTKLLKSDEIHVNGLLASYYGVEGVSGDGFRGVRVPAGSPRGGLLGMAAILAMGSNGERTSPVERGAWVLRHLLHSPPPPAPPNIPQLDRLAAHPISARERLLAHQEQPQCLQCHRRIDPIGLGLENFNAIGKWREVDRDPKTKKEWPIDPSGNFYKGPAFGNYFELRDHIAARGHDFAQGFTEALIEYALGRPYAFTDAKLADDILKKAVSENFVVREFLVALITSPEFARK